MYPLAATSYIWNHLKSLPGPRGVRLCTKRDVQNTAWNKQDHSGIAFRELVEACHDPAVLFQLAKHAFDDARNGLK